MRKDISEKLFYFCLGITAIFLCFKPKVLLKIYNTTPEKEVRILFKGYRWSDFFKNEEKEVFNSFEVEEDEEPKKYANVKEKQAINSGNVNYENVSINNLTDYATDIPSIMKNYEHINNKESFEILIVHTHGTEGYCDEKTARTTDIKNNVVAVGDVLAKELKKRGYKVLHDIKMHDNPSYNGSYKNCLKTVEWYFEHYNDIKIIFDVHRDAIEESDGSRVKLTYDKDGKKYAQLMLVSGSNEGGLKHDNYIENLKFAISLQKTINNNYKGLMRPIDFRKERFNQHLLNNYLIIEVGTHGNTIEEAKNSMVLFADGLDKYLNEIY